MPTVILRASLTCKRCKDKLSKGLSELRGVDTIDMDPESSKLTVTGNVEPYQVLKRARKYRKDAEFWPGSQYAAAASVSKYREEISPKREVFSSQSHQHKSSYSTKGWGSSSRNYQAWRPDNQPLIWRVCMIFITLCLIKWWFDSLIE